MALEQYFEEALAHSGLCESDGSCQRKWESPDIDKDSGVNRSCSFDCNICLDAVQEPVVTLCGHLYCWPCIYKWLHSVSSTREEEAPTSQLCPVCKADISLTSLVPLYGRGLAAKPSERKVPDLGVEIPKRPTAPGCSVETPRTPGRTYSPRPGHEDQSHESPRTHRFVEPDGHSFHASSPVYSRPRPGTRRLNLYDPTTGMLGETVYALVFGNSIPDFHDCPNSYSFIGSTSPRIRRRMAQADRSLGRMCFFLFCCAFLCLVLF